MRLITAFFKLVRLPNLIFIILTQVLFQLCVYYPLFNGQIQANDTFRFVMIVVASVFIAAAGYIINDYFDINIDEVNKPHKMVVDKIIHRRWAIAWHFILSLSGVICTIIAVPFLQKWYLILANMCCVAVLWLYSTNFKKSLLIGNIVIALLTSWTILIVFFSKYSLSDVFGSDTINNKFFRIAFLYAGFAFISTLIREAIKDMEDREGDEKYGCRTMPIVWGVHASKVYVAVWLIALIAILILVQVYVVHFRWWWPIIYSSALIILPLIYIFFELFKATSSKDFHNLSNWTKLVMLTGIISMIFFYFYL